MRSEIITWRIHPPIVPCPQNRITFLPSFCKGNLTNDTGLVSVLRFASQDLLHRNPEESSVGTEQKKSDLPRREIALNSHT